MMRLYGIELKKSNNSKCKKENVTTQVQLIDKLYNL